jgi:hypothetical protein
VGYYPDFPIILAIRVLSYVCPYTHRTGGYAKLHGRVDWPPSEAAP